MNPGSVFGSGFGQPQLSSPFGTTTGSASGSSTAFGTSTGFTPSGSNTQMFGSANTANTGFGNAGSGSGFAPVFGSPGLGSSPGTAFGSSGSSASSFGLGTSASAFGTLASTPGFGTGGMNQNVGFGSTNVSASGFGTSSGFGMSSGFGTGATPVSNTGSAAGNTGAPFGSGFNAGTTSAGLGTASPIFGTTSSGSNFKGSSLGTGGSGFGGGTTVFGSSSSGFGASSAGRASSGPAASTSAFGTGSSVFGTGATGFGTSTPGFGSVSSASGSGTFGSTTVSGFGGGSSMFGSFTSAQGTAATLSSTQTQSNPSFGGSSVFGTKTKTTIDGGQGFMSSSGVTGPSQAGSSVFGSKVTSSMKGFGGGAMSTFGQSPSSTAGVGSATNTMFGTSTGAGNTGSTSSVFGAVSKAGVGASGSAFGQAGTVFGASRTAQETSQMSSSAGGFSSGGVAPPPSYSASISSGQASLFTSSSTATVFGGASRTAPGGASVFGGASKSGSGQGSVFGGASRTTSGEGSVFGAASRTSSRERTAFGGASKPTSTEGSTFGGASRTTSSEGSVFGRTGRSVIKQETSQQSTPQMTSTVSQASVFGSPHPFGTIPAQSETGPSVAPAHPSSSASVFGGRSNFSSPFGGASQQQGMGVKAETASSVFGGGQSSEKKESFPRQPLFPAAASVKASSDQRIKHEPEHGRRSSSSASGKGPLPTSARDGQTASGRSGAESTSIASVFGGKRSFQTTEAVPGAFKADAVSTQSQKRSAAGDEEGAADIKRGRRTEVQQDQARSSTATHFQGQPSTSSGTPERVRLMRRSSSVLEDISSKTAIACKGIPANLNQGKILRSHFSRFGTVKLVRPVPSKRYAMIQFETHEAASRAKKHGTMLPGGDKPITIFWKSSATDRSPGSPEDAAQARPSWGRPGMAEAESRQGARSTYSLPSSVAAELASMSGSDADIGTGQKHHSRDRSAIEKRTGREGHSSRRREPTQQSRSRTPPPSTSTSNLPSSSASSLSKTTTVTVSGLRKMVATATMEKVNVLDTRDKLMRQKISKQTSGGVHSSAFVGTCPDMCPEKERLYREEVRRLSIYEIIPGSTTLTGSTSQVDHTKAVKEYSRSSADQDEPLPHELRPLPVLTMTMNYLLVEIANCGEDGKWAEWYDFLWNRTRSIRKEITQQQLCSQGVVDLLEKCVRFHIYCSERLCMEDMMVFDSKINDENLTKCLQTLKELYADMENKHGMYCPNEAEFRAYIVLMNLNEGDTLREVQQLRSEVRGSPEIGFAVKAYSALYSNNYVRFFRLVKNGSFLNACILHRYFNQIRARALQVILKSHTAGLKKVGFPLSELQRLLVFEKEEELREFCSYYGLRADGADLTLDRSAYVMPEASIPSWRAVGLVEPKRLLSVGEVINGGPLQPVSLPVPQCSFDEQGCFIGSLEGLVDDGQEPPLESIPPRHLPPPSSLSQQHPAASVSDAPGANRQVAVSDDFADPRQQPWKPSGEVVKSVARDLFFEVINEHAHQVAELVIAAEQNMRQCEAHIASELTASVVMDLARQVSTDVMEAERARQNQLLAAEKRERQARVAADVLITVINNTVEEEARKIALKEIEEEEARVAAEQRERCMLAVQSEVLQEVMGEMVVDVADEVYQVDVVARLQLLGDLQKAVELKRASQWLAIWRRAFKIRQRQKRAMLDFPCAPPMQPASQRLKSMYPDRPEHALSLVPGKAALLVNHRAQMTLLSPFESEQRSLMLTAHLSLVSLLNSRQRSRAWQPLNLASVLRSPLNQAIQQWPSRFLKELTPLNMQWKLLLSLPGEMEEEKDEEGDDSMTGAFTPDQLTPVLKEWLCAKFTRGDSSTNTSADSSKRNVLSQYGIEVASNAAAPSKLCVGVCVRTVPEFAKQSKKEQPTEEQSLSITKGTSAILFLLPHADTSDDTIWLGARLRLARLLEAKPFLPATPLALLLPCGLDTAPGSMTEEVTTRLGIPDFQEQGLVSDVAVVELAIRDRQPPDVAIATPVVQTQLLDAVKFLASKLPEPPDLRHERLGDIVEDMLTQHFFTPVLQDLKCRLGLSKLHQAPNTLIGLYNSVLDHVSLALTSPSLQDISWPAPELQLSASTRQDWNSKKHLGDIYALVSSLRLPWFHYKDSASTEWSQVCHDVWTFVNTVVKKRCNSAVSLTSRISRVLAHTCLQFENMCSLTHNEDHCTPTYVNAPWTDIIVACAEFRLQRLHNWKEEEEDVGGDLEVLFEEEDLEEFEPPAPWIQALLDTEDTDDCQAMEDTMEQASIVHFANQPAEEEDNITYSGAQIEHTSNADERRTTASAMETNKQAPPQLTRSDLPENIRSVWESSENLLLHVEEERQKAQAFERYLEKALQEDTTSDWNVSTIFPSPSVPGVMSTPAVHPATGVLSTPAVSSVSPSFSLSALRRGGRTMPSSTPRDSSTRRGSFPLQHSLEPRRLAEQDPGAGRFSEEGEDMQGEGSPRKMVPLSEGVELLKENLQAQKYANELFEKRLKSLLES